MRDESRAVINENYQMFFLKVVFLCYVSTYFTAIHPRYRTLSLAADFKAGGNASSVFLFKQWTRSSVHLRYRIKKGMRTESKVKRALELHPGYRSVSICIFFLFFFFS